MPDSTSSMRLLKCPACGGPLEPPTGESTMKCLYCGSSVVIPESLRLPAKSASTPQPGIFSGIDMSSMIGYGTQWAEIVQLAQGGNKEDAVRKYMKLTGNDESSARYMVNSLGGYQSYEFDTTNHVHQIYAPVMAQATESIKSATKFSLWLGCGITAFVMFILAVTLLPVLIGLFAGLTSMIK